MFLGGLTITITGLLIAVADAATTRAKDREFGSQPLPLLAGAGIIGFGIPILVRGAVSVPPIEAHASIRGPYITAGPTSASLTLEFD